MAKLIKMGKKGQHSVGITVPKDVCRKLEIDPNDYDEDIFVDVEFNKNENDIENKDILKVKVSWEKMEKSGLFAK